MEPLAVGKRHIGVKFLLAYSQHNLVHVCADNATYSRWRDSSALANFDSEYARYSAIKETEA